MFNDHNSIQLLVMCKSDTICGHRYNLSKQISGWVTTTKRTDKQQRLGHHNLSLI